MAKRQHLASKLLTRGDEVSVEQGQLLIRPKSGKSVDPAWMMQHTGQIYREILLATGLAAFQYEGYTVGHYGEKKSPGINLQFSNIRTDEAAYVVFNVILTRDRTTRYGTKGQRLPSGQFRVNKAFAFAKFWQKSGLPFPARLSAFHECMGKLRSVLFTGSVKQNNAIDKITIKPLEINHRQIATAFNIENFSDNYPTSFRQLTNNCPTTHRQESPTAKSTKGIQDKAYSDTQVRELNSTVKELRNKGGEDKGGSSHVVNTPISPEHQTNEQWLAGYDG